MSFWLPFFITFSLEITTVCSYLYMSFFPVKEIVLKNILSLRKKKKKNSAD